MHNQTIHEHSSVNALNTPSHHAHGSVIQVISVIMQVISVIYEELSTYQLVQPLKVRAVNALFNKCLKDSHKVHNFDENQ